ncbi:MAG: hypothetical protein JSW08_00145 [archaeon]|nr:MAG: hypothetical protein JSW08_00145 [archaeon]
MGFNKWANSKVKKLKWSHVQWIKLSVAAFILMVAKLWPGILALDWYWYLVIAIVAAIFPISKVFRK